MSALRNCGHEPRALEATRTNAATTVREWNELARQSRRRIRIIGKERIRPRLDDDGRRKQLALATERARREGRDTDGRPRVSRPPRMRHPKARTIGQEAWTRQTDGDRRKLGLR